MKKATRPTKKKTVRRAATRRPSQEFSLISDSKNTFWGKDQPMVLLLSAGIIICIVVGMYLSGWL